MSQAYLSSWNDGVAKRAIQDFAARVTTEGSPDFVPVPERVAVFDNDGTLWCEKPMPIQLDYILRRFLEAAEADPSLRERQPWKAAYTKDYAWLGETIVKHYHGDDSGVKLVLGALMQSFDGMGVEDYENSAEAFLSTAQHPTLKRPYRNCTYLPMIELLRYLEAHGFATYIASGGDRDFMRPIALPYYGIPPERVIGSSFGLEFRSDENGNSVIYKAAMDVFDDGDVKPARIWSRIGRRPIFAGGNANGDVPMLQFAGGKRPAMRLLVLHDDPTREFDYVAGAEKALELANAQGWTVVSVKNDRTTVFA